MLMGNIAHGKDDLTKLQVDQEDCDDLVESHSSGLS